jgi:hypothetical protein
MLLMQQIARREVAKTQTWIEITTRGPFDDLQAAIFRQIGGMTAMAMSRTWQWNCGRVIAARELAFRERRR